MFLLLALAALPLCAQTAANALPALAPAYGEIPPTFWEQHGTTIIIAGLVFAALAAVLIWKLLRPKPPVMIPPAMLAREALAKLQGQTEDGKLLSEGSQILRCYIAAAFGLSADEMTTAEFCTALEANEKIGTELAQMISSFLRECDARKFSPVGSVEPLNAAGRALELVSAAEVRRSRSASASVAAMPQPQEAAAHQQTQPSADVAASGDGRTP